MSLIVLGIFDNDDERNLQNLKTEEEVIKRTLTRLKASAQLIYYSEYNLGMRGMIDQISAYRETLNWFHFSGHHDQNLGIMLQDGNLESLVENLTNCPNLKGVFINGCSSKETIEKLSAHVPICIGTHRPVYDGIATEFSTQFYKELNSLEKWGDYNEIHKAYNIAAGSTNDLLRSGHIVGTSRGAGTIEDFESNIYYISPVSDEGKSQWNSRGPSKNNNLEKSKSLKDLLNELSENNDGYNYHEEVPYILGKFIKALNVEGSPDITDKYRDFGRDRYNLIREYFYCYLDVFRYAILSILWEEINDQRLTIKEDTLAKLMRRINNFRSNEILSLKGLCEEITDNFGKKKEKILVEKLKDSFDLFSEGVAFFSDNTYEDINAETLNAKAETLLHNLLEKSKCLNLYKIQSIHARYYMKQRNDKIHSFKVQYIRSSRSKDVDIEEEDNIRFANVHSVYFYKKEVENEVVIDLSPFYLDKNSYDADAKKMDLITVSRFNRDEEVFSYRNVFDPLKEKPRPEYELSSKGFSSNDSSPQIEAYVEELSKFENVYVQLIDLLNAAEK